jgi:hypothetical protein
LHNRRGAAEVFSIDVEEKLSLCFPALNLDIRDGKSFWIALGVSYA